MEHSSEVPVFDEAPTLRICVGGPTSMAGAELDEEEIADVVAQVDAALDDERDESGNLLDAAGRIDAICSSLLGLTKRLGEVKRTTAKKLSVEVVAQAVWLVVNGKDFEDNRPPSVVVFCEPNGDDEDSSTVRIVAYGDVDEFDEVVEAMREAGRIFGPDRRSYH